MQKIWMEDLGSEVEFAENLELFRPLGDRELREQGEIIVDSEKVVSRFLQAGGKVRYLLCPSSVLPKLDEQMEGSLESLVDHAYIASKKQMETITGYRLHHGVIARGMRPKDTPLAALGPKIMVLNGVCAAENVGAIVRNCEAFGFDSILLDDEACSPFVRRAIRCSMGSAFRVKVHHSSDLPASLGELAASGYRLIGTANEVESVTLSSCEPSGPVAVIIGSEGHGMSAEVRGLCHQVVRIPLSQNIDSLNAAVAAGIVCHFFSDF